MAVTGPDFISLQVRDLERSARVLRAVPGAEALRAGPPHAVVFDTKPIAFAVRDVVAGTDSDAIASRAIGDGDVAARARRAGHPRRPRRRRRGDRLAPVDGPFGRTFTFADPDGYQVTLHDRG